MSLSDKLNSLLTAKQNIKTSLTNAGCDVTSTPFTSYNTVIDTLKPKASVMLNGRTSTSSPVIEGYLKLTSNYSNGISGQTILLERVHDTNNSELGNNIKVTSTTTTTNSNGYYNFNLYDINMDTMSMTHVNWIDYVRVSYAGNSSYMNARSVWNRDNASM